MFYIFLTVGLFTTVTARPQGGHEDPQPRPVPYAPYGLDLQYDFSLLDPQLQYPGYAVQPRLQPQVFLYPGGTAGQPFLLQPGGHPGQPKPFVPSVNKDAEEIPTGPSLTAQGVQGRKPEKLESFDDSPELSSSEAEPFPTIDGIQSLKPGHRFFILNGQPLFSNYPLSQHPNNHHITNADRFKDFYKHAGPPHQYGGYPVYSKPSDNEYHQKTTTKHPKPSFDFKYNDLDFPQTFLRVNPKEDDQKQPESFANQIPSLFKLRPIEVPDEEGLIDDVNYGKEIDKFESKKESLGMKATEKSRKESPKEESISQAEPGAIALAGPGGVASATPRGTAFSGQKGPSISSSKATAIAAAAKEKDSKLTKNRKDKQ